MAANLGLFARLHARAALKRPRSLPKPSPRNPRPIRETLAHAAMSLRRGLANRAERTFSTALADCGPSAFKNFVRSVRAGDTRDHGKLALGAERV
jgi:hypothetical protein